MSSDFKIEDVRVSREPIPPKKSKEISESQPGGFVQGPISLKWIQQAMCLPGKAAHIGIILWYWIGIRKDLIFPLSASRLQGWGVTKFAALRAFKVLIQAGLIRIEKRKGKMGIVTIICEEVRIIRKELWKRG